MSFEGPAWPWLRGAGFIAGAALFWLVYFDLKDSLRKEPRRVLLASFALGCLSALLAVAGYRLAESLGAPEAPGAGTGEVLAYTLGLVGPIEEGAKYLVAVAVVFRWRWFDEAIDGLVYATAIAIGFASVENLVYLPQLGTVETLARALAAPLTHSVFASIWGFGAGWAHFVERRPARRVLWHAGSLVLAMVAHGLYDAFLLGWNATWPASALILVLWSFLIWHARRIVRRRHPA